MKKDVFIEEAIEVIEDNINVLVAAIPKTLLVKKASIIKIIGLLNTCKAKLEDKKIDKNAKYNLIFNLTRIYIQIREGEFYAA